MEFFFGSFGFVLLLVMFVIAKSVRIVNESLDGADPRRRNPDSSTRTEPEASRRNPVCRR